MLGRSKVRVQEKILDLLQALSSFLQSFLQPLELSSRVRRVTCDFVRSVVEDSVETNQPQTRLYQLGVETSCRNRTSVSITYYSFIWMELQYHMS